jgi:hypothetical protein
MAKLSKLDIEKPFTSHEDTLKEMYVLDGFVNMMEGLIEATRRRNDIIEPEALRFNQGELNGYKKILMRAERSFKATKEKKKPLESVNVTEIKL